MVFPAQAGIQVGHVLLGQADFEKALQTPGYPLAL